MNISLAIRPYFLLAFLAGLYASVHLGCRTRVLDYREKVLHGFPENICERTKLKKLSFGSSGGTLYPPLSAVPAESTNHIDSLPDCIANMTELEELSVSAVGLQQLTPALFQIKTLRKLDISFNPDLNLSPYWNEFIELPALSFLAVSGCEFDPKDLRKFQSERPEVEVINLGKWNTPR